MEGRLGANINIALDKRVSLIFDEEFRLGSEEDFSSGNNNNNYYFHTEIGVSLEAAKWLDVAFLFREIFDHGSAGWENEFRPQFDATLKRSWKHFGIEDRNRFEYRIIENSRNIGYYRNRPKFRFPFIIKNCSVAPYIADEIFVDLGNGAFGINRLYGGIEISPSGSIGLDLYYFWEYDRNDDPHVFNNVVGLKLKLFFSRLSESGQHP